MAKEHAQKRRKVIYRDQPDDKAAELEEFLFGSKGDAKTLFSKRGEADSDDDDLTLTDLLAPGGQLFFEDKGGHASPQSYSSEEDDEEEEEEEEGTDAEQEGEKGAQAQGGQAAGSSDGSDQEGEEEESDEEEEATKRAGGGASTSAPSAAAPSGGGGSGSRRRQPVWVDPADAQLDVDLAGKARLRKLRTSHQQTTVKGSAYEAALRRQHAALHPRTSWASLDPRSAAGKRGGSKRPPAPGDERDSGDEEDGADGDEEGVAGLLTRAGGLLAGGRGGRLLPGSIETSRLKDANVAGPSKAVVRAVGWHPSGQLMLTAGLDKKIRVFKVDGVDNPLVQAVFLADCPVHHAYWASGGAQIVAAGRRPFFFVYDLGSGTVERLQPKTGNCPPLKSLESFAVTGPGSTGPGGHMVAFCGDEGYIPLVSLASRQWVANLKMSGSVRCAAWAPGGNQLLTLGGDGVVYTWDIRTRRCMSQLRDHANIHPTSLALSPDGRCLATGSESGVVNIYPGPAASPDNTAGADLLGLGLLGTSGSGGGGARRAHRPPSALREGLLGGGVAAGHPLKEVMNLTTSVDSLCFSHDSQMLAFASRMKKDSMRLLHLPSCTVFQNWPTSRSPLHYVHSLSFSPHSGFLTIGNAKGRALLYRLHHYQEA